MKKLLTLLLVLVCSVGFGAGTTVEDKSGVSLKVSDIKIGSSGQAYKEFYVHMFTPSETASYSVYPFPFEEDNIIAIESVLHKSDSFVLCSNLGTDSDMTNNYYVYVYGGEIRVYISYTAVDLRSLPVDVIIKYKP